MLGALCVGVVLLVDMPAGLDAGGFAARFSGADAVLAEGFYAQLAAAGGMMLGGLLLAFSPWARKASPARRQRRPRTKPGNGLRRPAATMRGRA